MKKDPELTLVPIICSFDEEANKINDHFNARGISTLPLAGLPMTQGMVHYSTALKMSIKYLIHEIETCHQLADIMSDKQKIEVDDDEGQKQFIEFKTLDIELVHNLLKRIENAIGASEWKKYTSEDENGEEEKEENHTV